MIYYCLLPQRNLHIAKLEDLLKVLLNNGLKISTKEMSVIQERIYNIWVIQFSLRIGEFASKPLRN